MGAFATWLLAVVAAAAVGRCGAFQHALPRRQLATPQSYRGTRATAPRAPLHEFARWSSATTTTTMAAADDEGDGGPSLLAKLPSINQILYGGVL